jgi:hypothetical protein
MTEKKKNIKYTSIVPKPPHTLSGYQLFTKAKFGEFSEHISGSKIFPISSIAISYSSHQVKGFQNWEKCGNFFPFLKSKFSKSVQKF